MEVDSDSNSVSEAGKSNSDPVFMRKVFFSKELGDDDDGKPENLFPPFFMQLPSELILKILDSVSGVDIAKLSCVCSELRYLASSEDLWKQKYIIAQFGNYQERLGSERSFKERFAKAWEGRKSGNGVSSLNVMKRNRFNPFGCDLEGDDNEWREIVRLCQLRVGVP
uniref:F-box domain-containing protein n=1 Tax=Lactuca sativa TaxID=4236 RepID=A0A9R1VCC7_LACSA|nr:hypothetical protein LSAT_V11C500268850 [Lactuca sativa]